MEGSFIMVGSLGNHHKKGSSIRNIYFMKKGSNYEWDLRSETE